MSGGSWPRGGNWPQGGNWPRGGYWPQGGNWPSGEQLAEFSPLDIPDCVLYLDAADPAGITTVSATLASDVSTWTASNVAVVADDGGYRVTATSVTAPSVTGTPGDTGVSSVAQPPIVFTWQFKFTAANQSIVLVESALTGAAACRTWFDISAGTVGTNGSAHSSVSIGAADGNGWRTATLTVNSNATASRLRFLHVDADGVTTSATVNGLFFHVKNVTIQQVRVSAMANLVSAASYAPISANTQPGYEPEGLTTGQPAIRAYSTTSTPLQYLLSSEVAALIPTDGPFTAIVVVRPRSFANPTLVSGYLCQANSGSTTRRLDMLRISTTARFDPSTADDAGATASAAGGGIVALAPQVIVARSSGINFYGQVDGRASTPSPPAAFNVGTRTLNRTGILCSPRSTLNAGCNSSLQVALLYNRELTDPEVDALVQGALDQRVGSAIPVGMLKFEGDSITAGSGLGAGESYPLQTQAALGLTPVYWEYSNVSTSGHTLVQMTADAAAQVDASYSVANDHNVLVIFGGTNDIATAGDDGATAYATLESYCLARKAVGWTVVVVSMLPRTAGITGSPPGGFAVNRTAFNNSLLANWPTFADALADAGNDATLADPTDTTYYQDQIHPTAAGATIIAGYVTAAIEGL